MLAPGDAHYVGLIYMLRRRNICQFQHAVDFVGSTCSARFLHRKCNRWDDSEQPANGGGLMKVKGFALASAGLFAALAFAPIKSSASVISVTIAPSQTESSTYPGYYAWGLSATFDANIGSALITFYDLPGNLLTVSASVPASSQLVGDTPAGLSPTDDPALKNITFEPGSRTFATLPGTIFLGTAYFSVSTFDSITYAWQTQASDGSTATGVGTVRNAGTTVPEPGTLALLGLGLTGLALSRKRKSA